MMMLSYQSNRREEGEYVERRERRRERGHTLVL
jgi:hypothetical protein